MGALSLRIFSFTRLRDWALYRGGIRVAACRAGPIPSRVFARRFLAAAWDGLQTARPSRAARHLIVLFISPD